MDLQSLIAKLHPLERAILPALKSERDLVKISAAANLSPTEAMRAIQWLENKKLVTTQVQTRRIVFLDKNGLRYKEAGLPEKRFLRVLTEEFQSLPAIAKKAGLSAEELIACIGVLRRKAALNLQQDKELLLKLGPQGKKLLAEPSMEELFLKKNFPLPVDQLKDVDSFAFEELKKRKGLLKVDEQRQVTVTLTELGKKIVNMNLSGEVINRLTPQLLKTGEWKQQQFRAYDVEINVPRTFGGRKHFDNEALEYIKRIWLDLGFQEMTGNYVQSAFWDLDALFVPQDHPAREMQDTFYVPGKAKLPPLWEKVKQVHESGGKTGSTGWRTPFSKAEAERLLLRTHTTVLSAQTLARLKKNDLPAKFFAVGRVFRNEALDWKHLFEFYQIEGIVVDPYANLKHLKGYLNQFYKKMGYSQVRMRPAHFPYTEPSLEVDVYHPLRKEWIELGGAGIFRPEVVVPLLGFDCPVLAWGQGMGRIITEYWKIADIRELYKNDLKQLREIKGWLP